MRYLIITNIIWAFSFSLIGYYLAGNVDNYFSILSRFSLALIVFLPFMRWKINNKLKLKLIAIGAIQIGVMYIFYYQSFLYLTIAEVALFTIFTPLYLSLIYDFLNKRFKSLYLYSIALAVFGAFIIRYKNINDDFLVGFIFIQIANICFAFGQSAYKFTMQNNNINQKYIFGYFYIGAFGVGLISFLFFGDKSAMPSNITQWLILIYLGIIASGIGYFLWNKGACIVDSGVLAIMNNALIPLAIIVNILVFQTPLNNPMQLLIGSIIILASLYIHYKIIHYYKPLNKI